MKKFHLKPGTGYHREGRKMFKGPAVVESVKDLAALFPDKFEAAAANAVASEPVNAAALVTNPGVNVDAGLEVTDQFESPEGYKVFKQGRVYSIFGSQNNLVMTDLASKKAVNEYFAEVSEDFVDDEDEDEDE